MKSAKRYWALLLVVVTLFSVMTVPASASTQDRPINFSIGFYQKFLSPERKEDSTPCYVYVTSSTYNQSLYVTANGCSSSSSSAVKINKTLNGSGSVVDHVAIMPKSKYRVRNMIYENHFLYATLGFTVSANAGNQTVGKWSPDSSGTYQYAY